MMTGNVLVPNADIVELQRVAELVSYQLKRAVVKIAELEAANAAMLVALEDLVEIDRLDDIGDPDIVASERWRHEAWGIAYSIVGEDEREVDLSLGYSYRDEMVDSIDKALEAE